MTRLCREYYNIINFHSKHALDATEKDKRLIQWTYEDQNPNQIWELIIPYVSLRKVTP
jgi:hypothetical protein